MSSNFQYSRILTKRSSLSGVTPTINTGSTDHTDGTWAATDLYEGELYVNTKDDLMWIRTSNGILPIQLSGGTTVVNGAANLGSANGIFKGNNAGTLEFYSFSAGTNVAIDTSMSGSGYFTINASTGGSGEVNTASSVGGGNSIFKQKTGDDLEFRSLSAGTNITITTGDTITINSTGGGGGGTVISGLNTYTGGSFSLTSVNISGGTFNNVTITGNTSLTSASATSIVILNSGSSASDAVDYSSNIIKSGTTNSTIGAGSGNTINNNLRNVFVAGSNLTATTNDSAYFSKIYSGSTDLSSVIASSISGITMGNYLGKAGSTTISLTGTPLAFAFAISDETTQITSGTTAKFTMYAPTSMILTGVKASLTSSGSTGSQFDININNSSILSTKLTIDSNKFTSASSATPPVISSASIAENDKISCDIDLAGTSAAGAKIYLIGYRQL